MNINKDGNFMDTREVQKQATKEALYFVVLMALLIAFVLLISGCASATPRYDTQGNIIGIDGYGFFRDLEVSQVKADGSSLTIKSKSTSADIMKAGNEILGTMAGIAEKAKP